MQPTITSLVKQARNSAHYHGHKMGKFEYFAHNNHVRALGTCANCGAWVLCITHPAPNEIEVGGPAVAVGCDNIELD